MEIDSMVEDFERYVQIKSAEKAIIKDKITDLEEKVESEKHKLEVIEKSRVVVQKVAKDTQEQLEYRISNIVSLALASVFADPYEFKVRFVERRGKTECDLLFVRDNEEYDPINDSGGGPLDVASFALRLAFWTMNKTRPVFILDEPFKNLSVDLQEKCSEMVKILSEELGVQIIMVSHLPMIIQSADSVIPVNE